MFEKMFSWPSQAFLPLPASALDQQVRRLHDQTAGVWHSMATSHCRSVGRHHTQGKQEGACLRQLGDLAGQARMAFIRCQRETACHLRLTLLLLQNGTTDLTPRAP